MLKAHKNVQINIQLKAKTLSNNTKIDKAKKFRKIFH